MYCHHCGEEIRLQHKLGRQETCPKCESVLHCCLNCRFFDEVAYHQCRESQTEWVQDKRMANFCDYFEPGDKKGQSSSSKAEEARKKLDQLFKK